MSYTQQESLHFGRKNTLLGIAIFLLDVVLLVGLLYAALALPAWWQQLVCSMAAGVVIGILFVVGHDAAHNSLTPHRWLNRLLGRLSLLPALHPYSLWVLIHNETHHRWTNLSPQDYAWTPLSPQQYRALSLPGRMLYRFYRGLLGPLLYYLIEFWGKRMLWPTRQERERFKAGYILDRLLVLSGACGYLALLAVANLQGWLGGQTRPWWNVAVFGVLIPQFVWNALMSLVIYLHHTHPRIRWFDDQQRWKENISQIDTAVHVIFPGPINFIFHWIMEHNAHHERPSFPLYQLRSAQNLLEEKEGERIIVLRWTPWSHIEIVRRCKLYDFQAERWTDFRGNYTSD